MGDLALSELGLLVIAILIPVIGFVMTISHARKGDTRTEQRWRKRHGLLFWVLMPGFAGSLTLLGYVGVLPRLASLFGILLLSGSTYASWWMQQNRKEQP